jgi:hypothetical protein
LTLGAGQGLPRTIGDRTLGDRPWRRRCIFRAAGRFIENLGRREVRSRGDERRKEKPASSSLSSPLLLLRLRIGIDDVAVLYSSGHRMTCLLVSLNWSKVTAGDVLELREHRARFCPFPVIALSDFADHGLEAVAADVVGEFVVVEALRLRDRRGQHLAGRVAERNEAVTVPRGANLSRIAAAADCRSRASTVHTPDRCHPAPES